MNEKYITYRADRKVYQTKITIKYGKERKVITRTCKTLDDAIEAREDLFNMYKLDKALLVNVQEAKKQRLSVKKIEACPILENAISKWYEVSKRPFLQEKTISNYDSAMYDRIIPVFGKLSVDTITREMIQQWVNGLQKSGNMITGQGLNSESVRSLISKLHCFFEYLVMEDIVKRNPCIHIQYKRSKPKQKKILTKYETNSIFRVIKEYGTMIYLMYKLFFETGCRRGEVLGLSWDNVDLERNRIFICQTLQVSKNGIPYIKETPKNNSSIRWIPISIEMSFKLCFLKSRHNQYVFHAQGKSFMSPDRVSKNFVIYANRAGVKNVSLHCIRHTVTSNLVQAGVPIPIIQSIGGWSSPRILLSTYAHTSQENIRKAMENVVFSMGGR